MVAQHGATRARIRQWDKHKEIVLLFCVVLTTHVTSQALQLILISKLGDWFWTRGSRHELRSAGLSQSSDPPAPEWGGSQSCPQDTKVVISGWWRIWFRRGK